jgi:large subunit ribosomal protein L31
MRATRRSSGRDGNTYLVVDVDVSSASHPFYTGRSRVERFNRRYGRT